MTEAAYAMRAELGEDEVMVAIVLQLGKRLEPQELMHYCETHMAYFMIPRYVRLIEALPKTGTERTMKYQLKAEGITPDTWDREATGYKIIRQG